MIFIYTNVYITSIQFELTNIILVLDFILIGGILPFLERKKLAIIQRRVGPKYIGLNGRLQFIIDALKIFFKNCFFLIKVKKYGFFILPLGFLYINMLFIINFQWVNNIFLFDIDLNIIYFLVFSMISNILVILTGYFCKNKYTVLASSRSVSIFFINELLLTIIICEFFYLNKSFSFTDYICIDNINKIYLWLPQLPILILVFLLEINKVPFDFLEAESELIMGYSIEYVGFLFGVYILIEYLHIFIFSYFITILLI